MAQDGSAALPAPGSSGDALLQRAVEHFKRGELGADASLRSLAQAIGTSHRMLIYHFGTKERLLGAILREMRFSDQAAFRSGAVTRREVIRTLWQHYVDNPTLIRIFFYLAGLGLQDPKGFEEFFDQLFEGWTVLLTELGEQEGLDAAAAASQARVLTAGLRGLALEAEASGELASAERALEELLDLVEASGSREG